MRPATVDEEALARRREQNREAQRRFRSKQAQLREQASTAERPRQQQQQQHQRTSIPETGSSPGPLDFLNPANDMLLDHMGLEQQNDDEPPSGCFISSGLRLFGQYTLLDAFDMQGCSKLAAATSEDIGLTTLPSHLNWEAGRMPAGQDATSEPTPSLSSSLSTSYHWLTNPDTETGGAVVSHKTPTHGMGMRFDGERSGTWDNMGDAPAFDSHRLLSRDRDPYATPADSATLEESQARLEKSEGWMGPLHIAARNGHHRIARILLQHNSDCNEVDSDGLTPLHYAIVGGHEHVVSQLLGGGALLRSAGGGKGRTALHAAVLHRRETVLKLLLQHCAASGDRALVDCYDHAGQTALHVAVEIDFEAGVSLLLEHGADTSFRARNAAP